MGAEREIARRDEGVGGVVSDKQRIVVLVKALRELLEVEGADCARGGDYHDGMSGRQLAKDCRWCRARAAITDAEVK